MDNKQKLQLYRKLQTDISSGIVFAIDVFNEEIGKITERKIKELDETLASMDEEIKERDLKDGKDGEKGERGPQGLPGRDGKYIYGMDGKDGKNGKDGRNGIDGKDGRNGKNGKDGRNGVDGKNGMNGSSDTGEDIIRKINLIPMSSPLQIKGFRVQGSTKKEPTTKRYMHGGGDTVSAGNGINITNNADGTKSISVTGGGGFTELSATGTVNGNNTAFTFSQLPSYISSDGVFYKSTAKNGTVNWTWNAGTLTATMSIPPSEDIYGIA